MKYNSILLIDDDPDDQEFFIDALKSISATITPTVATHAGVALQKLEKKEIIAEVIFLDFYMPVMNGEQFLKEIKNRKSLHEIPVIMLSSSSRPAVIKATLDLGAIKYIVKPTKFQELVSILLQELA